MIGGFFGLSCFEERVKEVSSSEAPQKKGSVRTYSDSLERSRSVPMQSHLGSVILCLASTLRGWVQMDEQFHLYTLANYEESTYI